MYVQVTTHLASGASQTFCGLDLQTVINVSIQHSKPDWTIMDVHITDKNGNTTEMRLSSDPLRVQEPG
jgi:hypothetical protein